MNVPLADVPLRNVLGERLGLPVFVDNDATVAALAEASVDGEVAIDNLAMLTVGTGVGGGFVLNGRPYRGATGAAAELGHMLIGLDLEDDVPAPTASRSRARSRPSRPAPRSIGSRRRRRPLSRLLPGQAPRRGRRDHRPRRRRRRKGGTRSRSGCLRSSVGASASGSRT